jgi:N-acetylglutamate synthase-like GNAT family acetyltransferase
MEFTIRKAEQKDIPALQPLLAELAGHELTQENIEDRIRMVEESSSDELYVFEQEDKIQGLLGFRIRENIEEPSRYGEISALITKPETRRLGVGRALMEFAEQRARELNCKGTWLVSGFRREEEAHQFYARLGYKITGYRFVKPL